MCAILCLAVVAHPLAATAFTPALPQCKPAGDARTPMPVWSPDVTHDGRLSPAPPAGNGRIVYIDLFAENDDVHCEGAPDNESYAFTAPSRTAPGDLEVTIAGPATYVVSSSMCALFGFYVSEVTERDGKRRTRFRPVDKFETMSSGRYCLGKWTDAAPVPGSPAHAAPPIAESAPLPVCNRSGEARVPIAAWKPAVVSRGDEPAVFSAPPDGDGRIVYVSLALPPRTPCPKDPDELITLSRPDRLGRRADGGLLVNLRGNARQKDGRCVVEGFFMNEPVPGTSQGWIETYFGAVDEKRIAASGTYCLARGDEQPNRARR
jgi:hypothetical protein